MNTTKPTLEAQLVVVLETTARPITTFGMIEAMGLSLEDYRLRYEYQRAVRRLQEKGLIEAQGFMNGQRLYQISTARERKNEGEERCKSRST